MRTLCFSIVMLLAVRELTAQETGHQRSVSVTAATRMDFVFPLANQSPETVPEDWLPGYQSTEQRFELFVPDKYRNDKAWPLILFISAGDQPAGFAQWKSVCEQKGVLFASPFGAGNNTDMKKRVRIILDVLDDVRRTYRVDPDQTFIGGFSGGGRVACAIGFALPEYFGGVIPVCAAGDLREETWLRHRVISRLSVAHVTGENDFNRGEIERFRGPMLSDVGVRSKVWLVPKLGHAIPEAKTLANVLDWLQEGLPQRQQAAKDRPASRADERAVVDRQQQSEAMNQEARQLLKVKKTQYDGLMLLKGIFERWPDLPVATSAKETLVEFDQAADRSWELEDIAEQRRFLVARARRLSAYATGPLPEQYRRQRKEMASAAAQLWEIVLQDGQDKAAVAEAKKTLPELGRLIDDEKK